ncbi:hypothetical protein BB559_006962 [Furculomyces boomerangus]|uniref:LIM zinc-binding domain-containing protein n=1 Tax=Furculomyces boomerangus TaxID=61424 RepID=A0A2T9XZS4_9FUNG|nr:hypothetical protein BB559_006962 [Furculomyces boomerangus]
MFCRSCGNIVHGERCRNCGGRPVGSSLKSSITASEKNNSYQSGNFEQRILNRKTSFNEDIQNQSINRLAKTRSMVFNESPLPTPNFNSKPFVTPQNTSRQYRSNSIYILNDINNREKPISSLSEFPNLLGSTTFKNSQGVNFNFDRDIKKREQVSATNTSEFNLQKSPIDNSSIRNRPISIHSMNSPLQFHNKIDTSSPRQFPDQRILDSNTLSSQNNHTKKFIGLGNNSINNTSMKSIHQKNKRSESFSELMGRIKANDSINPPIFRNPNSPIPRENRTFSRESLYSNDNFGSRKLNSPIIALENRTFSPDLRPESRSFYNRRDVYTPTYFAPDKTNTDMKPKIETTPIQQPKLLIEEKCISPNLPHPNNKLSNVNLDKYTLPQSILRLEEQPSKNPSTLQTKDNSIHIPDNTLYYPTNKNLGIDTKKINISNRASSILKLEPTTPTTNIMAEARPITPKTNTRFEIRPSTPKTNNKVEAISTTPKTNSSPLKINLQSLTQPCTLCEKSLKFEEQKQFSSRPGEVFCHDCYNKEYTKGPCHGCGKQILTYGRPWIVHNNNYYHKLCLKCVNCTSLIVSKPNLYENEPYCDNCHKKYHGSLQKTQDPPKTPTKVLKNELISAALEPQLEKVSVTPVKTEEFVSEPTENYSPVKVLDEPYILTPLRSPTSTDSNTDTSPTQSFVESGEEKQKIIVDEKPQVYSKLTDINNPSPRGLKMMENKSTLPTSSILSNSSVLGDGLNIEEKKDIVNRLQMDLMMLSMSKPISSISYDSFNNRDLNFNGSVTSFISNVEHAPNNSISSITANGPDFGSSNEQIFFPDRTHSRNNKRVQKYLDAVRNKDDANLDTKKDISIETGKNDTISSTSSQNSNQSILIGSETEQSREQQNTDSTTFEGELELNKVNNENDSVDFGSSCTIDKDIDTKILEENVDIPSKNSNIGSSGDEVNETSKIFNTLEKLEDEKIGHDFEQKNIFSSQDMNTDVEDSGLDALKIKNSILNSDLYRDATIENNSTESTNSGLSVSTQNDKQMDSNLEETLNIQNRESNQNQFSGSQTLLDKKQSYKNLSPGLNRHSSIHKHKSTYGAPKSMNELPDLRNMNLKDKESSLINRSDNKRHLPSSIFMYRATGDSLNFNNMNSNASVIGNGGGLRGLTEAFNKSSVTNLSLILNSKENLVSGKSVDPLNTRKKSSPLGLKKILETRSSPRKTKGMKTSIKDKTLEATANYSNSTGKSFYNRLSAGFLSSDNESLPEIDIHNKSHIIEDLLNDTDCSSVESDYDDKDDTNSCSYCKLEIEDTWFNFHDGRKLHPHCFVCYTCKKTIDDGIYVMDAKKEYHPACVPVTPPVLSVEDVPPRNKSNGNINDSTPQDHKPTNLKRMTTINRKKSMVKNRKSTNNVTTTNQNVPKPAVDSDVELEDQDDTESVVSDVDEECDRCGNVIDGPRFYLTSGKKYHPDCFACFGCNERFDEGSYISYEGYEYHHHCVPLIVANSDASVEENTQVSKKDQKENLESLNNQLSPDIQNEQELDVEDQAIEELDIGEKDFYCAKCKKLIGGVFVHHNDLAYHPKCFTCVDCDRVITPQMPFGDIGNGLPCCEDCITLRYPE